MKVGFLLAVGLCLGCGHSTPGPQGQAQVQPTPPPDPQAQLYQNWRTANTNIDTALDNLEAGVNLAKQLASVAGGGSKSTDKEVGANQGFKEIADLLNSAGEELSDYDDVPASLDEFKKDFAARDENRLKSIDAAVSALQEVDSASDILDGLTSGAPAQFKSQLDDLDNDIGDSTDELKQAIKLMGGKIPAGDAGE